MHLVFLNQYYPPDGAPTGIALSAVVEELALQGHDVTVICAEGGYTENMPQQSEDSKTSIPHPRTNPTIIRIWATRFGRGTFFGKILDYLSYYLGVTWYLAIMLPKPNRIVALTTPPYLSVLARVMSKLRGVDHAHWVMDLYPDVMVAHEILQLDSLLHRLLAGLARWGMSGKRCATILTLGPDMAEKLKDNRAEDTRGLVSWVPLWSIGNETADDLAVAKRRSEMGWGEYELVVMYSGNMGLGHRFKDILEIAGQVTTQSNDLPPLDNLATIRFVFFGGGNRRSEIAEFIEKYPDAPVELHDYVPEEILSAHLQSADVHLASLDTKWTGTMLPSKLQGIFAVSRPVIFIGDENSGIGRWVSQSGGGWIVAPSDVGGLGDAIYQAHNRKDRESRGAAAKAYAEANFNRQINVRRVADILVC